MTNVSFKLCYFYTAKGAKLICLLLDQYIPCIYSTVPYAIYWLSARTMGSILTACHIFFPSDILDHRSVAGGAMTCFSNGCGSFHGSLGLTCLDGNHCSGHGYWSPTHKKCTCSTNYHGFNCGYFCDPATTCSGKGTCTNEGKCTCDSGTVLYLRFLMHEV